jgi:hypothetical protein
MAELIKKRVCAEIEGDFVVFLIGMRINKLWKVPAWLPVATAMPRMLKELSAQPEMGLLGFESWFSLPNAMVVQYWRSFEHLEAYARNRDLEHLPAWHAFNRAVGSSGDVGIWHETYLVKAGQYESIYNNMPLCGLGKASNLADAIGARQEARARIKKAA